MDDGLWVVFGLICSVVVVLVYIGDRMEARYHRLHPPNGYDGMREDEDDEHR